MSSILLNMILTLIQARYPGGLEKFKEDGGQVGPAPGKPPELLVYHPDIPIDVKNMLAQLSEQVGLTPRFVTTLNFDGQDPEEFREQFLNDKTVEKILSDLGLAGAVKVFFSPLLNVIGITGVVSTKENAEFLVEKLRAAIPGCLRTYVLYGDEQVLKAEYAPTQEPFYKLQAVLEAHSRTTVIGDDDLLNLKIALGNAQTVDEFINSL